MPAQLETHQAVGTKVYDPMMDLFLSDGGWTGWICLKSDAFRVMLAAAAATVCFTLVRELA